MRRNSLSDPLVDTAHKIPEGQRGACQAKGVKEELPPLWNVLVMLPLHTGVSVLISMPGKTTGKLQRDFEKATEMSRDLKNMLCTHIEQEIQPMLRKSGTS